MSDETYEGYKNRETWAFEVNWGNAQPVYNWVLATAQDFIRHKPDANDYEIGRMIIELVKDAANTADHDRHDFLPNTEQREFHKALAVMRNDVGSWWRVDETEVGESVRDSLKNEDMLAGPAEQEQ